ncbi:hypothetical protein I3843_06G011500, partial [Carya illinoinensis]
ADPLHSGSISFGRFENEALSWERRSSFSHNRYHEEVEKCSKPGSVIEKKAYFEAHFKKKGSSSEVNHYAHFDESPEGSAYQGEYLTGCKMENLKVLFPVPQMESASNRADVLVDGVAEDVNAEEIHQTGAGCDEILLVKAESDINGHPKHFRSNSNLLFTASITTICTNPYSTSTCNGNSLKNWFNTTTEVSDNPARVLTDISKTDPAKSPSRRERESTLRTSIEKSSVKTDIRTTRTVQRTPILEDSRNQKAKFVHDNKSGEKESMTMKAGESQPSSLKAETRRYQPLHRLSCTVNLTKADTSSSAAVFSFKSNEHAERRKEVNENAFYMELQQKMHAKEAEMNQMQVRRQEKTEAEIKQFRRSLNFKATPMPSFYHVAVPRRSDGKKAPSSNSKVNKARDKSTNPGSRAAGRSKSCLKEGSDQASSTNESVNTTARIDALEKTNCPTVGVENKVGRRKEREKERDTSMYKHRVSEIHKVMKGQRAEGKQKVGAREMARKDMKSSGIGSSSGLGNLVVGVAS